VLDVLGDRKARRPMSHAASARSIPALPAAATALPFSGRGEVSPPASSARLQVASVLQASGFRSDVTVFRLNARPRRRTGSEPAFTRNTAERVYMIEAAHNPERQVQILPPRYSEWPALGGLLGIVGQHPDLED
jgi:hypothetical protein